MNILDPAIYTANFALNLNSTGAVSGGIGGWESTCIPKVDAIVGQSAQTDMQGDNPKILAL